MHDFLKRYRGDLAALFAVAAVVGIFFFRLFWPEPRLIVTPDFGRSDAWHFSFATKLALAESLKRGELPLWEPRMGMGFPLFAEGQVGALFLPNLVLMSLPGLTGLNPVTAYNATYIALFLILGWGMYAWLRIIGCTKLASLFGAITVIFSGQTIPRLPHHTLLESLAMTPLILALGHLVFTKKHLLWISLFAFALSQQLFTGSPQPVLLTLLMVGIYAVAKGYRQGIALSLPTIGRITLGVVLALGIAAIQLLPSAEMLAESTSPGGFSPEEASYYSLPLVHLKTLVDPFILGNPKLGTYPPFTAFDGSIFWENNLYIGIVPLILLILGFIRPPLAMQGEALRKFLAAAIIVSFLLMLGKHSPLYLLYSVWPLNLFRVPSRFAWIFVLTLITMTSSVLSAMLSAGTEYFNNRHNTSKTITLLDMHVHVEYSKIVASLFSLGILITLGIHTYHLMNTWWDYHAIVPARPWLIPTPFIEEIKKTQGSVRTIGSELVHNRQFLKKGWGENLDHYQFLTNVPAPNSNLYWNLTQTDVYAGRFLKRPSLVESLLGSQIKSSESIATISAQGKKLLDIYHAATIITALPLNVEHPLREIATTRSADLTITAYRNPDALPRAYLATQTILAPTLTKAAEALASPTFLPGKTVIVHDAALTMNEEGAGGRVNITSENPTRVAMRVDGKAEQAILVFGDTYYPGWQAIVDGKPKTIFPVNIKERGIVVPKGTHEVIWQYRPKSLAIGTWISALSLILAVCPALAWLFRRYS